MFGSSNRTIIQTQTSKTTQKWVTEHKTKLLLCPFQSSDLNPVENKRGELKRRSTIMELSHNTTCHTISSTTSYCSTAGGICVSLFSIWGHHQTQEVCFHSPKGGALQHCFDPVMADTSIKWTRMCIFEQSAVRRNDGSMTICITWHQATNMCGE